MGRIIAGRLDGRCQRGCLCQRQIGGIHAEIGAGGGLYAIGPVAEIDVVQVHGENFILAHAAFQLQSQRDFLRLAGDGLFRAQVALTDQLHGDSAAALGIAALPDVGGQCAEEPHHIHSVMLIKTEILCRDEHIPDLLRDLFQGDHHPVLAAPDGSDQLALIVEHAPGLGGSGDFADIQPLPAGHIQHVEPY